MMEFLKDIDTVVAKVVQTEISMAGASASAWVSLMVDHLASLKVEWKDSM